MMFVTEEKKMRHDHVSLLCCVHSCMHYAIRLLYVVCYGDAHIKIITNVVGKFPVPSNVLTSDFLHKWLSCTRCSHTHSSVLWLYVLSKTAQPENRSNEFSTYWIQIFVHWIQTDLLLLVVWESRTCYSRWKVEILVFSVVCNT